MELFLSLEKGTEMDGLIGDQLIGIHFDTYRVIDIIAKSDFACIYKAENSLATDDIVIIKTINSNAFDRPADILKREAIVLWQLGRHPYIVRIIGFKEEESGSYMVLDYVDGGHVLKDAFKGAKLNPDKVMKYVQQLASALQHAHNKKICHCDIRPENILRTKDDDVVLCDFGLALMDAQKYTDERSNYKPDEKYLSPERNLQKFIDPTGDQYSLAMVAFEWLYGKLPRSDRDISIEQQVSGARYSREVGKVFEKALADTMEQRYESVTDFANALVQVLSDDIANNPSWVVASGPKSDSARVNGSASQPNIATESSVIKSSIPATSISPQTAIPEKPSRLPIMSRRTLLIGLTALPAAITLPLTWVKLWFGLSTGTYQSMSRSASFGSTLRVYQGHSKPVHAVAWSADSQWIASASSDGTLQVWKPGSEDERIILPGSAGDVNAVAWSHYVNNNLIAFCSGRSVYMWDFANGALPQHIYTANSTIRSLSWSPTLPVRLAIAGDHGIVLQLSGPELSQSSTPYVASTMKQDTMLSNVAWSFDSNYLAVCSKSNTSSVWVWSVSDGGQLQLPSHLPNRVVSIAWSPEAEYALAVGHESNDQYVQVWNIFTNENHHTDYRYLGVSPGIASVAWSPSVPSRVAKRYIAAGAESDGYVYVWNVDTSVYKSFDKHRQSSSDFQQFTNTNVDICALAWSPDGTMIASGGTDSLVRVWTSGIGTF